MPTRGEGYVHLGFQKLNEKDLKAILLKCAAPRRERRPRKCRRTVDSGIDSIQLPNIVKAINLVANMTLGNAGTEHLHLLPSTVEDLNLSVCCITSEGVKNICDFMKTNTSITRLAMFGNCIGDEGAAYLADMLCQNKTLRDLDLREGGIGVDGFSHISRGLSHNDTLHTIDLGCDPLVGDEHIRRLCPGLAVNQGLQTLGLKNSGLTYHGLVPIEVALRENYHLKSVKVSHCPDEEDEEDEEHYIMTGPGTTWFNISCWMDLNKRNRRVLLQDEDVTKWHETLMESHNDGNINAIYYFLRNKPDLCETFYTDD